MARNIEIKTRVADIDALTARVAAIAERGPVEILQDDTFFSCAAGRLKLRVFSTGDGELIFYRRDDQQGPKESFYVRSKTPEPGALLEVLSLAYGRVGRVQKRRTLYGVGRTRVHLDRVADLGNFLELEVVLEEHEAADVGVREVQQLLALLFAEPPQLIEGAYVDLLAGAGDVTA